ncbi:MAG: arginine--tRNA ligase [Candidatus Anstonellales archaeon]
MKAFERIVEACVGKGIDRKKAEFSISFPPNAHISTKAGFFANAQEIADALRSFPEFSEVWVEGGYINANFSDEYIIEELERIAEGIKLKRRKGKVVVEYPSVNPNKPWHAGHLRNALLGDAISNLLSSFGYDVVRLNYIDDAGLQVAQSLYFYLDEKGKEEGKFDQWLGRRYVEIAKKMGNEEVERGVREVMKRMESGELRGEARLMAEKCVMAQYETAHNFRVYQDICVFETDVLPFIEKAREMLIEKGVLKKGEGDYKDAEVCIAGGLQKVFRRSDGTFTYLGKDIAFHLWKIGALKGIGFTDFFRQGNGSMLKKSSLGSDGWEGASTVINVIGREQQEPQALIKEVMKQLGFTQYFHLTYEHVKLPGQRFSGRKGTWIGFSADELYAEAVERARKLSKGAHEEVARAAIRLAFLKVSPSKEITFKWDEALDIEGNSGPYIQYSAVRAGSILNKKGKGAEAEPGKSLDEMERKLALELMRTESVLEDSLRHYSVHGIAEHLLSLCSNFNRFYNSCKVIGDEREGARLLLVKAFRESAVLLSRILGIEVPERM